MKILYFFNAHNFEFEKYSLHIPGQSGTNIADQPWIGQIAGLFINTSATFPFACGPIYANAASMEKW